MRRDAFTTRKWAEKRENHPMAPDYTTTTATRTTLNSFLPLFENPPTMEDGHVQQ